MNKKRNIIIGICAAAIVIFLAVYCNSKYNLSFFSVQKWENYPEKRYMMVDNLTKRRKLEGMTKAEIYTLLGTVNSIRPSKLIINYSLGGADSMAILSIVFDDEGVCKSYSVSGIDK